MSLWIPYGIPKRIIPLVAGGRENPHSLRSGDNFQFRFIGIG